ncbi:MAG: hypothetical protein Q9200_007124 [Gallowayella weberi]
MSQNSPKKTGKGVTWDAVADAQLFKCVVTLHALTKGDYCSASAISHRIQRLKSKAGESVSATSGNDTDAVEPPATPKSPSAKKSRPSPKKKGPENVSVKGKAAVNGKAATNGKAAANGTAIGGKGENKRKRNDVKKEGEEKEADMAEVEDSVDEQGVKKLKVEEDAEEEEGLEV